MVTKVTVPNPVANVHGAPQHPLKDAAVEAPNPGQLAEKLAEKVKRKKLAHSMYPTAKQENDADGR